MGHEATIRKLREEYSNGLRKDWMPSPRVRSEQLSSNQVTVFVSLEKPLGEPWPDEPFRISLFHKLAGEEIELVNAALATDSQGSASIEFQLTGEVTNVWCGIARNKKNWTFPIDHSMKN